MLRVVEDQDWIVYCLVAVVVLYILTSRLFNKGASLLQMLKSVPDETDHTYLNSIFITFAYILTLSVFISPFIPIVPEFVANDLDINGYKLSKFGFTFISLLLFYPLKTVFSYLFYKATLSSKEWVFYVFSVNKYFIILTILFCGLTVAQYFYPVDSNLMFNYYIALLIFLFIGKQAYLAFNHYRTLPINWYYKILYICTLQILPYIAIGKFLFF